MVRRKKKIITNNKEIYKQLNLLPLVDKVILEDVKLSQITKIIGNINKNGTIVSLEVIGDKFIVKKKNPINFEMYLR